MPLTPYQQKIREGRATASFVPMILARPYDAWLIATGQVEPEPAGEAAEYGQFLEPSVLQLAQHRGGFKIARRNQTRVAPNGLMAATLDGETTDDDVVEAKTMGIANRYIDTSVWGEPGTDQVPDHVAAQCIAQLVCAPKARMVWVPVLMVGRGFALYRVDRDQAICDALEDRVCRFWKDHVEGGKPPPLDAGPIDLDLLKRVPRNESTTEIDAELALAWRAADAEAKAAEKKADELKARLIASLGGATLGICSAGDFSYRTENAGQRFDAERFRVEHPDLHAKYLKATTRVMPRWKPRKEGAK